MYAHELAVVDTRHLLGVAIALAVPVAAALNWTAIQKSRGGSVDLLVAVLIGAALSALMTLPLALPLRASAHDIAWLALLGVAQLAVPCLVAVAAARALLAPEVALLSLLEVVFGVSWTWLAGEAPSADVLVGGALVLAALVGNESIALRRRNLVVNAT
jgi:drug/metabolite transporter (DMT)-like permease